MKRVAPHLGLARNVRISNVWLLSHGDETYLIDTGHPIERPALAYHLWRAGIRAPGDLTAVILTHRHSDHAGNAAWLRERFGCAVVCHLADAPFLTGAEVPPPLATPDTALWARLLCHVEDRMPARTVVDESLEGSRSWRGFRVFHVPGHTEGSMILHHEPTGTLFSGDSILCGPATLRIVEQVRMSHDHFSWDGPLARSSVRAVLSEIPRTEVLCSGHGPPVKDDVAEKLERLFTRDWLWPRLKH